MNIYQGCRDQKYGYVTYSQHGEDLALVNIFTLLGIDKPSYLDLGCHHPQNISNTHLLWKRGSSGVNVDANQSHIDKFNEARPDDINLCIGIGTEIGEMTFYMYDDLSGRNTFSTEEVKSLEGIMTIRKEIKVPVTTLDHIVEFYCEEKYPDLLSMDLEGFDYDVLYSADFNKSRPKVICVETRLKDTEKMQNMIGDKFYTLYARFGENLIFIDTPYFSRALSGI